MIERFVGKANRSWEYHFKSGVNSILLRLLEKEDIQGKVFALPAVNTDLLKLVDASIFATIWSLDESLSFSSTNMVGCDRAGFDPSEKRWKRNLKGLLKFKKENGDCNVPFIYKEKNQPSVSLDE